MMKHDAISEQTNRNANNAPLFEANTQMTLMAMPSQTLVLRTHYMEQHHSIAEAVAFTIEGSIDRAQQRNFNQE